MNEAALESMSNLVAEIFRIEKSPSLHASIPPFLSFLKWTTKAGAQQDSLKRAMKVWFTRAQKPAKLIDEADAIEEMAIEEMEPMLEERIQKWTDEIMARGKAEGLVEGKAEGKAEGLVEGRMSLFVSLFERKFGPLSDEIRVRAASLDADALVLLIEQVVMAKSPADLFTSE